MLKPLSLVLIGCLITACQSLQPQSKPPSAVTVSTSSEYSLSKPDVSPPVLTPAYEQFDDTLSPETSEQLQPAQPATPAQQQQQIVDEVAQQPASAEPQPVEPVIATDLWQLTRDHYGLDLNIDNPRIQAQLNWYKKHPKYIDRVTSRASRYYYHVINEVIERGMPAELALLPIVESAFDPFAYSHGRAAGPWQFIPMTAKRFKLKHSWWYDGRRDVVESTRAALDYLQLLNKRFDGDWLHALAAYNAGGGNVNKAIRKNRQRGKPTDFWSLDLPKETSAYVPKLIALAKLFQQPEAYQLSLAPIPNQPYFEAVDTDSQIDLAKAAELAQISIEELYLLNPGFNQWATDPSGPHRLLVPTEKADGFRQALADYPPEQRVSWIRYKIKSGDSLIRIAKHHHTTVDTLRSTNAIRGNMIRAGQVILIPKASQQASRYVFSQGQRQEKKNQRIALRSGKSKLSYKVKSGDSFWKIARTHGVGVRQLAAWNQMAPGDPLRIGQKLVIWQPAGTTSSNTVVANAIDSRKVMRKIGYRVRNGDSLARIASKFNVRLKDIRRWNSKIANAKYLQPGQHLTLYVDVTQIRR